MFTYDNLFYWSQWAISGVLFYLGYHTIAYAGNIQVSLAFTFFAGLVCPFFRTIRSTGE